MSTRTTHENTAQASLDFDSVVLGRADCKIDMQMQSMYCTVELNQKAKLSISWSLYVSTPAKFG